MRSRSFVRMFIVGLAAVCCMLAAPALAAAEPKPFGHACKAESGVRFCPTVELSERVPTFDGVPLDVDVTLPPTGEGPFPTIVMMHGWGGSKADFESTSPEGNGNETWHYNNTYYAQQGFAVLNYSARGWGRSCGEQASREGTPGCEKGWVHLSDQRFENHDAQYLLGLLADEKIVRPKAIGVTGISYGGGQSIELAYLKNRVRERNNNFVPWKSPKGKEMAIAAAYPRWPWSDLISSLTPNGRYLDTEMPSTLNSREPLGVEIESYVEGLLALGEATGFIAPPGADPEADLVKWNTATNAGEQPKGSPGIKEDEEIAEKIYNYHQGWGLSGRPAPLLIQNGWTDDLFPPKEALRVYNAVRAMKGSVRLQFGDLGHSRGANKENEDHAFQEEGAKFFVSHLKREGLLATGVVTAYTQTCPSKPSTPAGGPFKAKTWTKLHPHTVSFSSAAGQTFTSAGGNPEIAAGFDPIADKEGACKSVKAEEEPNTANYTTKSQGFTMMGLGTITATVKAVGTFPVLVARLWDVTPKGEQLLISRSVYRLSESQENTTSTISFQLHGNGYKFPAGDTVKLQLLGRDAPYYRPSNGTFTLETSNVTLTLPTT